MKVYDIVAAPTDGGRRQKIAAEIADRLIADLLESPCGACICDDQTDDARQKIIAAIESAMAKECETT